MQDFNNWIEILEILWYQKLQNLPTEERPVTTQFSPTASIAYNIAGWVILLEKIIILRKLHDFKLIILNWR